MLKSEVSSFLPLSCHDPQRKEAELDLGGALSPLHWLLHREQALLCMQGVTIPAVIAETSRVPAVKVSAQA
jgi:hypothetical protein